MALSKRLPDWGERDELSGGILEADFSDKASAQLAYFPDQEELIILPGGLIVIDEENEISEAIKDTQGMVSHHRLLCG